MMLIHTSEPLYGRILNQIAGNTREATVLRYSIAGVYRVSDRGLRDGLLSAY